MLLYPKSQHTQWELSTRTQATIAAGIVLTHAGLLAWLNLSAPTTGYAVTTTNESPLFVQWITPPSPATKVSSPATTAPVAIKTAAQPKHEVAKQAVTGQNASTSQTTTSSTAAPSASSAPVRVLSVSYTQPPKPIYPVQSQKLGEEGTVDILVTLDEKGSVQSATVHRSSGFARLDNAALQAVRHARYQPHTDHGQAVRAQAIIPISFTLEEESP